MQPDLPGDDALQRNRYLGHDVADEGYGPSLAGAVDCGGDGFVTTDCLECEIDAASVAEAKNLLNVTGTDASLEKPEPRTAAAVR